MNNYPDHLGGGGGGCDDNPIIFIYIIRGFCYG